MPPNLSTLPAKESKMARLKRKYSEPERDHHQLKVQNQNISKYYRTPGNQSRHGRAKNCSDLLSFCSGNHCQILIPTKQQHSSNLPFQTHHPCCHHFHLLVLLILALFYCPQPSTGSATSSPSSSSPSNDQHHHHHHQHYYNSQQHLPRPSLQQQQSNVKWGNSSIVSDLVSSKNSSSSPGDAHLDSALADRHHFPVHQRGGSSHQHGSHYHRGCSAEQQQRHKRNLLHQGSAASSSTKYLLNSDGTSTSSSGPYFSAHYQPPSDSTYQQQPPPGPPPPPPPPPPNGHQMYSGASHPMLAALPPLQILPIENETASVGRNAVLKCVINRPGQYKVAWLKMDDRNELTLLTLGLHPLVTEDEGKYRVTHNERQWLLHISRVTVADRGRYMCQINAKTMTSQTGYLDVYEPPVINEELTSSDTTVDELQKVSLRCATSGYPAPSVSWRRESGKALNLGLYGGKKHAAKSLDGEYLNISQVTREDMGPYLCIASNGVPPSVSKRIVLQVNFRPKIRVHSQLVSAYLGSDVELECRVEASPRPETAWLTGTGQKLEELMDQMETIGGNSSSNFEAQQLNTGGDANSKNLGAPTAKQISGKSFQSNDLLPSKRKKYQFDEENDGYRTVMRLTLRRLESVDFGSYKCVAKNGLGEKEGLVRLYEIPVPTLPPTTTTSTSTALPPPPPPRTQKSVSVGGGDKTPWTTRDGHDTGQQQYGPHSSNYGSRSLRENQHQQNEKTGTAKNGGDFGDDDEEEMDETDDYQLKKYLTEHYQTKKRKKATTNGGQQRSCGSNYGLILLGLGGLCGGRLWWLSLATLILAFSYMLIS